MWQIIAYFINSGTKKLLYPPKLQYCVKMIDCASLMIG